MAGRVLHDWPADDELLALVQENGRQAAADKLGVTLSGLTHRLHRQGLAKQTQATRKPGSPIVRGRAIEWPADDELVKIVQECGSVLAAARWMNVSHGGLQSHLSKRDLTERAKTSRPVKQTPPPEASEPAGVKVNGATAVITGEPTSRPTLGNIGQLIRERGLDPDEWVVGPIGLNEWDAMAAVKRGDEPRLVRMRQWKVTLYRHPRLLFPTPAVHVPPVKRTRVGPAPSDRPETILVEGDHQIPYHDAGLHEASLVMLGDLSRKYRLAEHVFLGDTGDFPTISRHDDHPAAMAEVKAVIQGVYDVLREKREAAPNVRVRKLKGNHDWRVDSELLKRAERMYAIAPAQRWEDLTPELPALHLTRLLHLDQLGVELIEDPRGWQHAEVELVPGIRGLVVRHGWLTGAKTAEASVKKRGRSIIVGHIHRREHAFIWDPSAECERQGVVAGTMSLVRDERYPHYTTLDNWLQGCVIVTRWPDGDFQVEHVRWNGEALRWRDRSWRG